MKKTSLGSLVPSREEALFTAILNYFSFTYRNLDSETYTRVTYNP
jgi:hypothetical protein